MSDSRAFMNSAVREQLLGESLRQVPMKGNIHESKRKVMNRNWYNQKANPALNTKAGNK